ncbi:type II toxin-antitoxin system RelE/ParE family toxin [Sphingobium sp. CR2-8]|uniref:type II toxin-antitoxin system RelE/ParE family toxin n=1 Tax=Sphingobium sp. CR2-8 TaxID=1306534 RepID=UPI002DB72F62|nr:type II toxin-antitoxin system RelE/ParE family toxin [Sphingobium sp. CR2-8]MEC3910263.1 type II toxin-antitoxin system RelE/ParE family toxin [Sphingobium sp. CR2-8]
MTVTVRFAAAAERDLAEIATYTEAEWGPLQARAYLVAIADAVDRIAAFAGIGSPIGDVRSGYRKLRVERHNIYYRHQGTGIEIVRILHQRAEHLPKLQ